MEVATLVKDYLSVLVWPVVVLVVSIKYLPPIAARLKVKEVSVEMFGVKVEATVEEFERTLAAVWRGELTEPQWALLEKLYARAVVNVRDEGLKLTMGNDLDWIRPIRNAGVLMSLPEGRYIEQATELVLTPLGRLLMDSRSRHAPPNKRLHPAAVDAPTNRRG